MWTVALAWACVTCVLVAVELAELLTLYAMLMTRSSDT